jgi:hypothetical protein
VIVWASLASAALLVATVLGVVLMRDSGDAGGRHPETARGASSSTRPGGAPPVAGVQPRRTNPANVIQAEHTLHQSRLEEYAKLAAKAPDLMQTLQEGDTQWSDFLIDLHFSETAQEIHEKCLSAFLKEVCKYTISYVVEADGSGEGKIVYAKAALPAEAGPTCEPYARCVTRERVGTKLAVPDQMRGLIGHRNTQADGHDEDGFSDPKSLSQAIGQLEESLEILRRMGPDSSADWAWQVAHHEMQIRVFRKMLERAEGA